MLRVADGRVFVVASVDGDVGEVHEVEEGRLRRIRRGTGRWFAPYRQEAERVTVKRRTLPDVDGWLVRAKTGRGARPLIVRPHGGPFDAFGPVSRFEDLALAARGYHVLRPNPRGSISYGEGFARALDGVWGDPDSEDIFALIDRLGARRARRPLADGRDGAVLRWLHGALAARELPGTVQGRCEREPLHDRDGRLRGRRLRRGHRGRHGSAAVARRCEVACPESRVPDHAQFGAAAAARVARAICGALRSIPRSRSRRCGWRASRPRWCDTRGSTT